MGSSVLYLDPMSTPEPQNPKLTPIARAIQAAGSMAALARSLGITKAAVHQWKHPSRRVPIAHCTAIERLTDGAVLCEELRPDVDWTVLLKRSKKRKVAA